jgi:lipopolysaccharide export system protein LptA
VSLPGGVCSTVAALGFAILLAGAGEAQQGPAKARPGASASKPPAAGDKASDDRNAPVTVDADSLESLQKEGLAVFKGNVVARQNNSVQYAERMEVYTDAKTNRVERVISTGNVRIVTRDCRMGSATRAEYYDAEQRVVLIGNARVWRDDNVVTGERITIYLAEDRSLVEGGKQDRVKAVFYPSSQDRPKSDPKTGPGGPVCP